MQLLTIEQEALGWMLMTGDQFQLQKQHFSDRRHAVIFQAIQWCHANQVHGDTVEVALALQEMGHLEAIGGRPYLDTLIQKCPQFAAAAFRAAEMLKSDYATQLSRSTG